jgi:chromosome segregation ATPase
VSAIARKAGVDRSFFYRSQHKDLLAQIHAAETEPSPSAGAGPVVSRASLKADLANNQERCARLAARVQQLEKRLSRALGDQTWRESGLGAPDDIEDLKQRIILLEEDKAALTLQLEERTEDLEAARATNRELMARLNRSAP